MSQTTFDEDELFEEATEEMQADVDDALARAREAVPTEEAVLAADDEDLRAVLDSLTTTLDVEAIEAALQDAQKAFVLGQRAEAFDDDYISETEATIATLNETTDALRAIDAAATDLAEALTAFRDTPEEDTATEEADETDVEDEDEGEQVNLTDTADE